MKIFYFVYRILNKLNLFIFIEVLLDVASKNIKKKWQLNDVNYLKNLNTWNKYSHYKFQKKLNYRYPTKSVFNLEINQIESEFKIDKSFFLNNKALIEYGAWNHQKDADEKQNVVQEILIDDLIGIRGKSIPNNQEVIKYLNFLSNNYFFGWNARSIYAKIQKKIILADLGSVVDVGIIKGLNLNESINILEIGGGYGRLAEAILNNNVNVNKYVMTDALPQSLFIAKKFLSKNGLLNLNKATNFEIILQGVDIFEKNLDSYFDLIINVESFQEMTQHWVDFWVGQINLRSKIGTFFYNSNSSNYKNFFKLQLGENWKLIKRIDHPRHWTSGHLTEIYQKVN